MKVLSLLIIMLWALASPSFAQPSGVLIEACNAVPDSKKRLVCLKELLQPKAPQIKSANLPGQPALAGAELALAEAVQICDRLLTGLRSRRSTATEDAEISTAAEMSVTWPPLEGKLPTHCNVERSSRKVVSITSGGKVLSGKIITDMERSSIERDEIAAGNYANFTARAKAAITASFKDPASAQFQSLFLSGKALPVLCGEVNGKNSYGGFVGFRRFYATGQPSLNDVENPRENFVFAQMWPSMCAEKIADIP
jgi:hypothetical protein